MPLLGIPPLLLRSRPSDSLVRRPVCYRARRVANGSLRELSFMGKGHLLRLVCRTIGQVPAQVRASLGAAHLDHPLPVFLYKKLLWLFLWRNQEAGNPSCDPIIQRHHQAATSAPLPTGYKQREKPACGLWQRERRLSSYLVPAAQDSHLQTIPSAGPPLASAPLLMPLRARPMASVQVAPAQGGGHPDRRSL